MRLANKLRPLKLRYWRNQLEIIVSILKNYFFIQIGLFECLISSRNDLLGIQVLNSGGASSPQQIGNADIKFNLSLNKFGVCGVVRSNSGWAHAQPEPPSPRPWFQPDYYFCNLH